MSPRWHLRNILLSSKAASQTLYIWGSPGEYSMIDCFMGNNFEVLSCPFWSTVLQCGAQLQIHTVYYMDLVVIGARFLTGAVFECDIAHRRYFAVLCMQYKIMYNSTHAPSIWWSTWTVPVRVQAELLSRIGILLSFLAAEPRSTIGLLLSSRVSLDQSC